MAAGVSETLDRDALAFEVLSGRLHRFHQDLDAALRGRGVAAARATVRNALAGDDRRRRGAIQPAVFVSYPVHDARVGVHVGGGDVDVRADVAPDAFRISARQRLELVLR